MDFLYNYDNFREYSKERMKFECSFNYWRETLLEYCTRLFTWENLPVTIPQHEIELTAFIQGYAPLVKLSNGDWICAISSGMYDVTDYPDEFKKLTFATPLHFGKRDIGKTAVIVKNNTLKNSLMPKIERYATLLAHAEITAICELVNDRAQNLIECMSTVHKEGAQTFLDNLYDGDLQAFLNMGFAGIRVTPLQSRTNAESSRAWDVRNNILCAFFEEIGIRKTENKKERMITNEINADNEMLYLNLSDMLESRQNAAKEFNKITGYNVSVKCNIDYDVDVDKSNGEGENDNVKTAERNV